MSIRPLANRIVVKQKPAKETINSFIVIPDTVKDKPTEGEVVAVGPGKYEKGKLIPVTVKVGDVVLFAKGTGMTVNVNKQDYIVMYDQDILGVIDQ
jgi:chaperonin GroES